jgi:hypothetical protein
LVYKGDDIEWYLIPAEKAEPFGARYIFSRDGLLIMEDLSSLGFRMADRREGLDLAHCLIVMRRLARFHAASVILHQRDPDCMAPFLQDLFTEKANHKEFSQMFSGVCLCAFREILLCVCEYYCLPLRDGVKYGTYLPTFRRNFPPPSSG